MRRQFKQAVTTSAAITTILPMLGFVAWTKLTRENFPGPSPLTDSLGMVVTLGGLALIAGAASFYIMPLMLRSIARSAEQGKTKWPPTSDKPGQVMEPLDAYAGGMMLANVTSMAAGEVPLLLAFVLTIQTEDWRVLAVGGVVAVILWVSHFPRFSRWERLLRAEEARRSGIPQIIS